LYAFIFDAMLIVYVLLVLFLLFLVLFVLIVVNFKNPVLKYTPPDDAGFDVKEVWFPASNGKKLHGLYVFQHQDAPTVIFVHGWGKNAGTMTVYLKNLCCRGYNMLAIDARSHGLSDADGYSSMLKFAEDIVSAVDFILSLPELINKDIYLLGLSIGGGASLYAASHDNRIKKVVTVGAFANPADIMKREIKARHIPYFPFIFLFFKLVELYIGAKLDDIAPVNNIFKSKAKIFIIHGKKDSVVPFEQAEKLKKAAGKADIKMWGIENRGHSNCHLERGFWDKIDDFYKER
jgi:pimeloyl-ACP methyl ester carboxylesterase